MSEEEYFKSVDDMCNEDDGCEDMSDARLCLIAAGIILMAVGLTMCIMRLAS